MLQGQAKEGGCERLEGCAKLTALRCFALHCRGHNGKVRSLAWSANDAHIVSCGTEGAVYQWKLRTFKRARESVLKVSPHPQSLKPVQGRVPFPSSEAHLWHRFAKLGPFIGCQPPEAR